MENKPLEGKVYLVFYVKEFETEILEGVFGNEQDAEKYVEDAHKKEISNGRKKSMFDIEEWHIGWTRKDARG